MPGIKSVARESQKERQAQGEKKMKRTRRLNTSYKRRGTHKRKCLFLLLSFSELTLENSSRS